MEEKNYYIWSNEHNAWWGHNNLGYASTVDKAGLYTRKQAIDICNTANCGWDTEGFSSIPCELPIHKDAAVHLTHKSEYHPEQ